MANIFSVFSKFTKYSIKSHSNNMLIIKKSLPLIIILLYMKNEILRVMNRHNRGKAAEIAVTLAATGYLSRY